MSKIVLRPFLVFVVLAAGFRVLFALGSGLVGAHSVRQALVAFVVVPIFLVATTVWLALSKQRRRAAMLIALGTLVVSLATAAVGLSEFVMARANDVPVDTAWLDIATLQNAAGLGLCAAALCWGFACAANIFESESQADLDRRDSGAVGS